MSKAPGNPPEPSKANPKGKPFPDVHKLGTAWGGGSPEGQSNKSGEPEKVKNPQ